MAAKTGRIEVRTDAEREHRIRYAAELSNVSVSAFVLDAASERAERVITSASVTTVTGDFFDALWEALEEPPAPNPVLTRRAARARRVTQR
jgi:uncharacterized protein (DUF1778 family)